jgi:hypothetical protein
MGCLDSFFHFNSLKPKVHIMLEHYQFGAGGRAGGG